VVVVHKEVVQELLYQVQFQVLRQIQAVVLVEVEQVL
jgi:hypothetical protein